MSTSWSKVNVPAWRGTRTYLEEREHLALFLPVQQTVVVLHGDERGEVVRYRVACRI
jgi:hypothetical protein